MSDKKIQFTSEKVDQLQAMYDKAVSGNVTVFVFEGEEMLTRYAKYLLIYLRERFKE